MAKFIKTSELDATRVIGKPLEKKEVKSEPGKFYKQIALQYNYGTQQNPAPGMLRIQLPKVTCAGIKPNKYRAGEFLINVRFDMKDEECKLFALKFPEIFKATCMILYNDRLKADLEYFEVDRPMVSKYRSPFFYPKDPETNRIMTERDPYMQIKLIKRGTPGQEELSLFTDLNKKPIDWILLQNVQIRLQPVIQIEKIYLGSNPSLQTKLKCAAVFNVEKRNNSTLQDDEIDNYNLENPDASDNLSEMLARLANERMADNGALPTQSSQTAQNAQSTSSSGMQNKQENSVQQMQNFLSEPPKQQNSQQSSQQSNLAQLTSNSDMSDAMKKMSFSQAPTIPQSMQQQTQQMPSQQQSGGFSLPSLSSINSSPMLNIRSTSPS